MAVTKFPVLSNAQDRTAHPEWPSYVDWDKLQPYEWVAVKYHQQTLCTLASRGGLSLRELYCVIHETPFLKTAFPSDDAIVSKRLDGTITS